MVILAIFIALRERDKAFFKCDDGYIIILCAWPKIVNLAVFHSVTSA